MNYFSLSILYSYCVLLDAHGKKYFLLLNRSPSQSTSRLHDQWFVQCIKKPGRMGGAFWLYKLVFATGFLDFFSLSDDYTLIRSRLPMNTPSQLESRPLSIALSCRKTVSYALTQAWVSLFSSCGPTFTEQPHSYVSPLSASLGERNGVVWKLSNRV